MDAKIGVDTAENEPIMLMTYTMGISISYLQAKKKKCCFITCACVRDILHKHIRLVLRCIDADIGNQMHIVFIFQHFSRSRRSSLLRTFGVEVEKTMENHIVDPTENT